MNLYLYGRASPVVMVDPNGMQEKKPESIWDHVKRGFSLTYILETNRESSKQVRDYVSRGARGAAAALGGGETAQDIAETALRTPTKMLQSGIDFFDPVKTFGGLYQSVTTKGVEATVVEGVTAPLISLSQAKQAFASGDIGGAADALGDFLFQTYTLAVGAAAKAPTAAGKGAPPGLAPALADGPVLAGAGTGLGSLPLLAALEGTALGGLVSMMTGGDDEKDKEEAGGTGSTPSTTGPAKGLGGRGWRGDKAWRDAVKLVEAGDTIESFGASKVIPTRQEAIDLISASGGKVLRIEGPHAAPNPHSYPHINYTTSSGAKGTIRIQGL